MSIATVLRLGFGSDGSAALVLRLGFGAPASDQSAGGGIDWENWAEPPGGLRRVLDTAGIDLGAQREALLDRARREIGLFREGPLPDAPPVQAAPPIPLIAAIPLPIPAPFDKARYAEIVGALVRDAIIAAEAAEAARLDGIERDNEEALLLMATCA